MPENFSSIENCPIHGSMAPRIKGLPFIGNLFEIRKRPLDLLVDGAAEHGSIYRLSVFGKNLHVISGQTAIDLINENDETLIHRKDLFDAFAEQTNVDIFGVMGDQHRLLKGLVRLGYSRQIAAPFVPEMTRRLTEVIRSWPSEIKLLDRLGDLAAEAVATALTPERLDTPIEVFGDFGHRLMMVTVRQWPNVVFSLPRHKGQKRQIRQTIESVIRKHREGKYEDCEHPYMIDGFIHTNVDGHQMADADILGASIYGLCGTHIYCGRTSAFMIFEMLKNPKLLERVLEEVDAAFDEDGLNAKLLRRMTYLRAALQESLRRYPMLPGLPFRAARDLVIDGYEVAKDDVLLLTGMPQHFLHKGYDNPWAFDANRCMAPRNEHKIQGAYSPWGIQPRTCAAIGLNEIAIMTTVATVLRTVELSLLNASYNFEVEMRPLLCPKDRFPAQVIGLREESDYKATRELLTSRQVEEENLIEPMYDFELPQLEPEEVLAGQSVFEQGDPATDFYIIVRGKAEVVKTVNEESSVVAELEDGDSFGEIGLLNGVPRTAAVRAVEALKLLRLNREQFLDMISNSDLVANELGYIIQKRFLKKSLMQTIPSLDAKAFAKASSGFEVVYFDQNEIVFEEGEAADSIYIIISGEFEVVRNQGAEEMILSRCGPGEMIGEIGVLQRQPRMATVRNSASGHGVMARISREKAEAMFVSSGKTQNELAVFVSKRLMEDVELMAKRNESNSEGTE